MVTFVSLLLTTLFFIILDLAWFQFAVPRFYEPTFTAIQGHGISMRIAGGLFAWLLLAFGVQYFVLDKEMDAKNAFIRGALMGFVIYGVYNGTNYATFSNYDMKTFIADTTWGTFVTGTVSLLAWKFL